MNRTDKINGLYLITDDSERLIERVSAALPYVSVVQFRPKKLTSAEKLERGKDLAAICKKAGVLFIVNDDVKLALELDADGVHLGQEDGDPCAARELLGSQKIIGVSTHNPDEAILAEAAGADYIGFGAIYPTGSKDVQHLPGVALLAETRKTVSLPIVAIGGIGRDNAAAVIDAGADAVAVISAVMSHEEPSLAAAEMKLIFNRKKNLPRGAVLTIAGSDSGGGAGIQADLKTITLLGSYGASVITALTAQNTLGVTGIHPAPEVFVTEQIDAVLSDIPIDVVKTGMLFSAGIIDAVAEQLAHYDKTFLVVDPVMIAKGGAALIDRCAVDTFIKRLLPMTYLLTPNIPEAEALTGMTISDLNDMENAARALQRFGARNVLIKGGHSAGTESVDLLFDGSGYRSYGAPRIDSANTHGTGCTLSSAIATFLAQGDSLPDAIGRAKEFITCAIRLAEPLGKGHGPVNHYKAVFG
ncbi:MAG: bifunctional hydroxymethylpyrimidine kinase/phosphomethylpyrimidine kinase [Geobacteraceae bacterium]|nr:bifunctional hydroxymethylpyrimidine kinase/phosphomethylpyrimidine kinase [Geobacteraceae bacterium]